eukprot:jgi/Chrzof1/8107/UNPLg00152.t1
MQLLTTKCLNTSVALSYLFLGEEGLQHAEYCSLQQVKARADDNARVVQSLIAEVRKPITTRQLYYILMSDGKFSAPDHPRFFPGHVFILEAIPGAPPTFFMYQSYIGHYTLSGAIARHNGTLEMSFEETLQMLEGIKHVVTTDVWDQRCVDVWQNMTFVDTGPDAGAANLFGSDPRNQLYLCFRKAPVSACFANLRRFLKDKQQELLNTAIGVDEVWMAELFSRQDAAPLTKGQLLARIQEMLDGFSETAGGGASRRTRRQTHVRH